MLKWVQKKDFEILGLTRNFYTRKYSQKNITEIYNTFLNNFNWVMYSSTVEREGCARWHSRERSLCSVAHSREKLGLQAALQRDRVKVDVHALLVDTGKVEPPNKEQRHQGRWQETSDVLSTADWPGEFCATPHWLKLEGMAHDSVDWPWTSHRSSSS